MATSHQAAAKAANENSSAQKSLKLAQLDPVESAKRAAAYAAVDNHVKPEHEIIGIGSGESSPDDVLFALRAYCTD